MPKNESLLDVITVYRSAVTALACTCNPWREADQNLPDQLFAHFRSQSETRPRKSVVLPDDLASFEASEHVSLPPKVQGWSSQEISSSSSRLQERRTQMKHEKALK